MEVVQKTRQQKHNEYLVRLRASRKIQGLCYDCGRPVMQGSVQCVYHRQLFNERLKKRRLTFTSQGKCRECGKVTEGFYLCPSCAWKHSLSRKESYPKHREEDLRKDRARVQRYKEQGRCTKCGRPLMEEELGRNECFGCMTNKNGIKSRGLIHAYSN